jgi:hypothetical protein
MSRRSVAVHSFVRSPVSAQKHHERAEHRAQLDGERVDLLGSATVSGSFPIPAIALERPRREGQGRSEAAERFLPLVRGAERERQALGALRDLARGAR